MVIITPPVSEHLLRVKKLISFSRVVLESIDNGLLLIFSLTSWLTVGPEVLSRGEIYLGLEAQKMGLVDALGSQADAVAEAARMARIRHYRVTDRSPELPEDEFYYGLWRGTTAATVAAVPKNLPPGFYYRYIEPAQ